MNPPVHDRLGTRQERESAQLLFTRLSWTPWLLAVVLCLSLTPADADPAAAPAGDTSAGSNDLPALPPLDCRLCRSSLDRNRKDSDSAREVEFGRLDFSGSFGGSHRRDRCIRQDDSRPCSSPPEFRRGQFHEAVPESRVYLVVWCPGRLRSLG